MSSADEQGLNDQVLSRYLLGSLPREETERLDELSIADDEFALRLDAVENDLVDAYARGELADDELRQFQKSYLSSPRKRDKVEFARILLRFAEKKPTAVAAATRPGETPDTRPTSPVLKDRFLWRRFTAPRLNLQWGFAVVAVLLFFTSAFLFNENELLRKQRAESRGQQTALEHRTQELQEQLNEQHTANDGLSKELEGLRASVSGSHALRTIAVLLSAPTRGAGQIPAVTVPSGTEQVRIRLQLEPNDFSSYQVALIDSATNHILWKATKLMAKSEGQSEVVSVNLPASLLKQQRYIVELTGITAQGSAELLTSYAFKVVLE